MNRLLFLFITAILLNDAQGMPAQKEDPIYVHGDNGIEIDHSRMEARAFKNAYVRRGDSTLFGDAIYAFYEERQKKLELVRAEAYGKVRAVAPDKIIEAREGRYDAKKDIILFRGDVQITKENHHLRGRYALMDRKTGRTTVLNHDPFMAGGELPEEKEQVRILLKGQ